jgi:hypothetical protein
MKAESVRAVRFVLLLRHDSRAGVAQKGVDAAVTGLPENAAVGTLVFFDSASCWRRVAGANCTGRYRGGFHELAASRTRVFGPGDRLRRTERAVPVPYDVPTGKIGVIESFLVLAEREGFVTNSTLSRCIPCFLALQASRVYR